MTTTVPVRAELFSPDRRATTIGIVMLISIVAFEAMGVGTAMPAVVDDLGAVAQYAWPFVAFMAAAVFGTVLVGRWCDRAGPRGALLASPLVFMAGLALAGSATTLVQLLGGRALQGLGAGGVGVAVYVLIAVVYPERARPAVFALTSSAWVLPTLIGPPISGAVTEAWSWHWVFLGLIPLTLVATLLVVPAVRALTPPADARPARRWLVPAAFGAAVGVTALSWAGEHVDGTAAVVAVVALVVLVPSLSRLLPGGVVTARRGISSVVLARGMLAGTFFAANSFVPLMLNGTHGWSLTVAGLPLIAGSLGWSSASAWQGRHPDLSRSMLLRVGFALVATGVAGLLLVAPTWGPAWVAVPAWAIAGVGMGLGFSSISFLLLKQSEAGDVGFNTAAAQIADQLSTALLIGLGGALLSLLGTPPAALPVLLVALVAIALVGTTVVAGRTAHTAMSPVPGRQST
ncbi:MFS transporter [Pseudonocardia sp. CA-107938]|uniref:MFS transporter n=1 Tax=Pseudonocardia sp. CA-107938 TaxID=3240021 RepID=UPI003D92368B